MQEAEVSELTAVPHKRHNEVVNAVAMPTECCPTPQVHIVHLEFVAHVEALATLLEAVIGANPVCRLAPEPRTEVEQEATPHCEGATWVLPSRSHRPRDHSDVLRGLQLQLKLRGSDWDVGALAKFSVTSSSSPLELLNSQVQPSFGRLQKQFYPKSRRPQKGRRKSPENEMRPRTLQALMPTSYGCTAHV